MSVTSFKLFYDSIKRDSAIVEAFHEEKKQLLLKMQIKNDIDLVDKVVIPFAQKMGFNFTIGDILEYSAEIKEDSKVDLTDAELEAVSGGTETNAIISFLMLMELLFLLPPVVKGSIGKAANKLRERKETTDTVSKGYPQIAVQKFLEFFEKHSNLPKISEQFPYNEIDALVFSTLVYLPMSLIPKLGACISGYTIKDFSDFLIPYLKGDIQDIASEISPEEQHVTDEYKKSIAKSSREQHIIKLLQSVASNLRYKDIEVGDFFAKFEKSPETGRIEQFAGVTFTLNDGMKIIAMRGTDGTLVGWKEDLDLGWKHTVNAQNSASFYLDTILSMPPSSKASVVGHSKGGHLAVYSALNLIEKNPAQGEKVVSVYNFDGPGIKKELMDRFKNIYDEAKLKIFNYFPQTAIVGEVYCNQKDGAQYQRVYSDAYFIKQHDNFSWYLHSFCMEAGREKFVKPIGKNDDVTNRVISRTIKGVLENSSAQDIQLFSNALFKLFGYEDDKAIMLEKTISSTLRSPRVIMNILSLTKDELRALIYMLELALDNFMRAFENESSTEVREKVNFLEVLITALKEKDKQALKQVAARGFGKAVSIVKFFSNI